MDFVEILILTVGIYQLLKWVKRTRAWILLKGFAVLLLFTLAAKLLHMDTIYWLAEKILGLGITALLVVFQPELRKGLEELGKKKFLQGIPLLDPVREEAGLFSDRTLNEIVKASFEMGKVRTGALIVLQQNYPLTEYERTGIALDSIVSSQLLINIFEHNTPLHDGAVIIRGDRVTSATCYLPLSDNMELSKELGTRHRAGVGISEVTDSFTIIVSEETGNVSYASGGELHTAVTPSDLREQLHKIQKLAKKPEEKKGWHIHGMRQKVEGEKK